MTSEFWYIATPYTKYEKGVVAAFEDASKAAALLVRDHQLNVFCPIAHTHPLAIYGGLPDTDYKLWLGLDQPFIEAATGLIVVHMPGWEISYGVTFEIEQFVQLNKPIRHFSWPDLREIIPQ